MYFNAFFLAAILFFVFNDTMKNSKNTISFSFAIETISLRKESTTTTMIFSMEIDIVFQIVLK